MIDPLDEAAEVRRLDLFESRVRGALRAARRDRRALRLIRRFRGM